MPFFCKVLVRAGRGGDVHQENENKSRSRSQRRSRARSNRPRRSSSSAAMATAARPLLDGRLEEPCPYVAEEQTVIQLGRIRYKFGLCPSSCCCFDFPFSL